MKTNQRNPLGPQLNVLNDRLAPVHPQREEPVDYAEVDAIVERYRALKASEALVLILQDVQRKHRYIPEPAMRLIGERMGLPMVQIYGVASFYQDFSMQPRAEFAINICEGTSCFVRGSDRLRRAIVDRLGIDFGDQTPDGRFGVERADYCYGCCQLGPVVEVNHRFHRDMTPERLVALIDELARTPPGGARVGHAGAPEPVATAAPAGAGPASDHATPSVNAEAAIEGTAEQDTERLTIHGDRVGEDAGAHESQRAPATPHAGDKKSTQVE